MAAETPLFFYLSFPGVQLPFRKVWGEEEAGSWLCCQKAQRESLESSDAQCYKRGHWSFIFTVLVNFHGDIFMGSDKKVKAQPWETCAGNSAQRAEKEASELAEQWVRPCPFSSVKIL